METLHLTISRCPLELVHKTETADKMIKDLRCEESVDTVYVKIFNSCTS